MHNSAKDDFAKIMQSRLRKVSRFDIRSTFTAAQNARVTNESVDRHAVRILSWLGYISMPVATHRLYRARIWTCESELPTALSEGLEPPSALTELGRCNKPGRPVLYLADNPQALVAECGLALGDVFLMLQFAHRHSQEDISCVPIGLDPNLYFDGDPMLQESMNYQKTFFGDCHSKHSYVQSQLHSAFVAKNTNDDAVHRFTAAIADRLLFSGVGVEGIFYPSVATVGNSHNFAVIPNAWRRAYKANAAFLVRLKPDGEFEILNRAFVGDTDTLHWGADVEVEGPIPVNMRTIDPSDPRIYIAPWKI